MSDASRNGHAANIGNVESLSGSADYPGPQVPVGLRSGNVAVASVVQIENTVTAGGGADMPADAAVAAEWMARTGMRLPSFLDLP